MGFMDFLINDEDKFAKQKMVQGYVQYSRAADWKHYNAIQMDEVFQHRESILEQYRNYWGITREELSWAQQNKKTLTEDRKKDIVRRTMKSILLTYNGAITNGKFFVLTDYENVVVDARDIFAVAYTPAKGVMGGKYDGLTYAFFTNDPYVPVFWIAVPSGTEISMAQMLEISNINLTYPMDTMKALKKTIKKEGAVKGNLEKEYMLKQLSRTISGIWLPDASLLTEKTKSFVEQYGYICNLDMRKILKLDSSLAGSFWRKEFKSVSQEAV